MIQPRVETVYNLSGPLEIFDDYGPGVGVGRQN